MNKVNIGKIFKTSYFNLCLLNTISGKWQTKTTKLSDPEGHWSL